MDRGSPLPLGDRSVNTSAFAFLFAEVVRWASANVSTTNELEERLSSVGQRVGLRVLELLTHRERSDRRVLDRVAALQFVQGPVWRCLFGRQADRLEKSTERNDQYFIFDNRPLCNRSISVPKDLGALNCAAFMAGVIKGVLDHAGFVS